MFYWGLDRPASLTYIQSTSLNIDTHRERERHGDEREFGGAADGAEIPAGGDLGRWISEDQAIALLLHSLHSDCARKSCAVVYGMD